jgi:N-methylhydantoinase B
LDPKHESAILPEIIQKSLIYTSEEMGVALRNSSFSPNIKERLDHSCAIFTSKGELLAQAEHIPVHLGSLPVGLRNTIKFLNARKIPVRKGSMILVNDPHIAGTHLNDFTLIRPVYFYKRKIGYCANKAHHSDVGGLTPGSLSHAAKRLEDEGTVIEPTLVINDDELHWDRIREIAGRTRMPNMTIGDLSAQVAANMVGDRRLFELVRSFGETSFEDACKEILRRSEQALRDDVRARLGGASSATDFLESRSGRLLPLQVRITINKRAGEILVNYDGSHEQVREPLNAVLGVTLSGVYYAIKCVTNPEIQMNEGFFRPIKVNVPFSSILNPDRGFPVSGGNVETSQRNADLLLKCLSHVRGAPIVGASQGTMNNIMLGSSKWAFYETIGGGMGARDSKDGIDGIQCHMTNTLNTPIEELEATFPILVTSYQFRKDSCGLGRFRGGCGLVRSWKLRRTSDKEDVCFTIVAERHRLSPRGVRGGRSGAVGAAFLKRKGVKRCVKLKSKDSILLSQDDEVIVFTPGGGGYGRIVDRPSSARKRDIEDGLVSPSSYSRIETKRKRPVLDSSR